VLRGVNERTIVVRPDSRKPRLDPRNLSTAKPSRDASVHQQQVKHQARMFRLAASFPLPTPADDFGRDFSGLRGAVVRAAAIKANPYLNAKANASSQVAVRGQHQPEAAVRIHRKKRKYIRKALDLVVFESSGAVSLPRKPPAELILG
jgi:hypothetical protein